MIHAWTDGVTVWIDKGGFTIARFGKMGIDVHTPDASGCLHCTFGKTTAEDWEHFCRDLEKYYDFKVPENLRPVRFADV